MPENPEKLLLLEIMAEEKDATSVPLSQGVREEEEGRDPEDPLKSPPTSADSSTRRVSDF